MVDGPARRADHPGQFRPPRADRADARAVGAAERRASSGCGDDLDFLLIDTAAGISDNVIEMLTRRATASGGDLARADRGGRRLRDGEDPDGARPGEGNRAARQRRARRRRGGARVPAARHRGHAVPAPAAAVLRLRRRTTRRSARRCSCSGRSSTTRPQSPSSRRFRLLGDARGRRWRRWAGPGCGSCRAPTPAPAHGRTGGAAVRMTTAPSTANARRTRPARDRARRAGQGDGAPAGAAPAVAGRDDRPDQRRRARPDRRGRPVPAVDGRAVRRVRAPARAGRDARRAARSRLGAALAPQAAPRPRPHHRPAAARARRASPRKTRSPRRWRCRRRNTPRCSTRCARSTSARSGSSTRRARTARRCSSCASTRTRAPTCSSSASNCARLLAQRPHRAARTRTADPGALLRGRADDGRDRRGHRRLRVARVAAAVAGAVPPAREPARRRSAWPEKR